MVNSILRWGFTEKYLFKSILETSGVLELAYTSSQGTVVRNSSQLHIQWAHLVPCNWKYWEYLYHINWKMLQIRGLVFCFFSHRAGLPISLFESITKLYDYFWKIYYYCDMILCNSRKFWNPLHKRLKELHDHINICRKSTW